MKLKVLFLFFCFSILCYSCKNDKQSSEKELIPSAEIDLKDISELSYLEIYNALYADNNGGFDLHGDAYGQDAISNISIVEELKDSCGKALFVVSDASNNISLAVKSSFNFPGNSANEMLRAYRIKPTEKISIGNSKLCYNGKEYQIKREIISAGFATN